MFSKTRRAACGKFDSPRITRSGSRHRIGRDCEHQWNSGLAVCRAGFSLVEIMVVIVIIGLLAGATTIAVRSYLNAGRRGTARLEITNIKKALETYQSVYGKYPTQEEGLAALQRPTADYPDGFLENDLDDPWSHPYEYFVVQGKKDPFEIVSYGADGRPGGSGGDSDISSLNMSPAQQ